MKAVNITILIVFLSSCGGATSDYSEELSGEYLYINEGEGANAILSKSKNIANIFYLKKYDDNGAYISAWQGDTSITHKPGFKSTDIQRNTYYPNDRFYIIDIKNDSLLGPYRKDDFFRKTKELNISIHWKPVVTAY